MTEARAISAKDAKAAGLSTYFTGKPCKRGNVAARRASNRQCTCAQCDGAESRRRKEWYESNREAISAHRADCRDGNRAKEAERVREWRKANPAAVLASAHRYRARKLNATPSWGGELTDFVAREAADLAALREAETGFKWEVDHAIPLAGRNVSGLHVWNNIQVIPMRANRMKSNRHVVA